MGKTLSFTEENVKKNPYDYPKLKLTKGETALLTYVEDPVAEYVHRIEKPMLDEAGNVLYTTKDRLNGTQYQVPKTTWVSSPICLGDADVLDEEGIDPANCPICERAAAGEKGARPKRRFAMHVIRTNTVPNTFDANETGASLIIWAFTDQIFNQLFALQKQWGLDKHDLQLGPCEDAVMQKAKLAIAPGTAVTEDIKKKVYVDKNKADDPTIFCGTRKSKDRILEDLAQVDAQWAKSNGDTDSGDVVSDSVDLSSGISSLLDEEPAPAKETPKAKTEPATSVEDLPDSEPAPKAAASKTLDVDDILGDL